MKRLKILLPVVIAFSLFVTGCQFGGYSQDSAKNLLYKATMTYYVDHDWKAYKETLNKYNRIWEVKLHFDAYKCYQVKELTDFSYSKFFHKGDVTAYDVTAVLKFKNGRKTAVNNVYYVTYNQEDKKYTMAFNNDLLPDKDLLDMDKNDEFEEYCYESDAFVNCIYQENNVVYKDQKYIDKLDKAIKTYIAKNKELAKAGKDYPAIKF